MKAFITGIAGFAGTHLAEHLIRQGDLVAGSVRPSAGHDANRSVLPSSVELANWDITQPAPKALRIALDRFQPELIFHLASISVPAKCGRDQPTAEATAVNVDGTRNVLELAGGLSRPPRIVFISTSLVYAPVNRVRQRINEDWPTDPRGAYGKTKLVAEQFVRDAIEKDGLDAVIFRAFQHAGPRQRDELMLSEWCRQIGCGVSPLRIRNRDSYLDMTDVRDVVRAYRELAQKAKPGEIYNVGSGRALRSGDVFDQLRERYAPACPTIEESPGVRSNAIADIDRLIKRTGWQPEVPLARTLQDTMEYWRNQLS